MKLKSRYQGKKAKIEIIPMIDVIFFLLVVFMMASRGAFHERAMPVQLPESSAVAGDYHGNVHVVIKSDGQVYIDGMVYLLTLLSAKCVVS